MKCITFSLTVLYTAILTGLSLSAQNLRPAQLVDDAKTAQSFEESYTLFAATKNNVRLTDKTATGHVLYNDKDLPIPPDPT